MTNKSKLQEKTIILEAQSDPTGGQSSPYGLKWQNGVKVNKALGMGSTSWKEYTYNKNHTAEARKYLVQAEEGTLSAENFEKSKKLLKQINWILAGKGNGTFTAWGKFNSDAIGKTRDVLKELIKEYEKEEEPAAAETVPRRSAVPASAAVPADFDCQRTEFATRGDWDTWSDIAYGKDEEGEYACKTTQHVRIIAGVKEKWDVAVRKWVKEGGADTDAGDEEKGYKIKGKKIVLNTWSDVKALRKDNEQAYEDATLIIVKSSKGKYTPGTGDVPKGSSTTFTRAGYYDWKGDAADAGGGKGAWVRRKRSGSGEKKVYGTSTSWRPSGRGKAKREQYMQFYKDLKKAGLLKMLFKKGKIRQREVDRILKEAVDGLDFAWGKLHRNAYKELLKVKGATAAGSPAAAGQYKYLDAKQASTVEAELEKAKDPGYPGRTYAPNKTVPAKIASYIWMEVLKLEQINPKDKDQVADWKSIEAKAKLAGGGPAAPTGFDQRQMQIWNKNRARLGLGPLAGDQLKPDFINNIRRAGPYLGLTSDEAVAYFQSQGKAAGTARKPAATAYKRRMVGSIIMKDARALQVAISDTGDDANAEIERIVDMYAAGEEIEDTGISRTLTQLRTAFTKWTKKDLIQVLIDDDEERLANIVRYGAGGEGGSKGVLRRGGADKQYDAGLENEAARLIAAGPDKTGTDEDEIKRVVNRNLKNIVGLAKAYRQMASEKGLEGPAANLVTMIYDEMGNEDGIAKKVQTHLSRRAQSIRESKMSKLRKLRKLFKEEYKRKLSEQTTGPMTIPSGGEIGGMSIAPDDLESILDEPHPSSAEAPSVGAASTSSSGLKYTPERKAFIRYIKGLSKKGKLSKAQEKKLRRALFSKKYTPRDMAGKEITKLINKEVVAKMGLNTLSVDKTLAGVEGALSGKKASVGKLKASLKRLQSGPQNDRTSKSIARVKRMIARAEQRGPDLDMRQMAQDLPGKLGSKASLPQLKAALKRLESGPQNPATKKAAERAKRMIARAMSPQQAPEANMMQMAQNLLKDLGKSKTASEMEASLQKMKSASNASSPEMKRAIERGERMLARKRREESPTSQVATDI